MKSNFYWHFNTAYPSFREGKFLFINTVTLCAQNSCQLVKEDPLKYLLHIMCNVCLIFKNLYEGPPDLIGPAYRT